MHVLDALTWVFAWERSEHDLLLLLRTAIFCAVRRTVNFERVKSLELSKSSPTTQYASIGMP